MDYYKTLGVERNATPEDIKKAYRKMAAKHHPDRGGDTAEFQKVEEAYRHLTDPNLKHQHDNPNPFGQGGGNPFGDFHFNFGGGNPFDDIFGQFRRQQQQQRMYTVAVALTLEKVARGDVETIQLSTPTGPKTIEIKIPKGIENGQHIRYDGIMPDGILQIEFRVLPHIEFERRGLDLYVTRKISIYDLLLGTTIRVKTILGDELDVNIPARTRPDATMRISGKGLERDGIKGSQYVLISTQMPDTISPELLALLEAERNK
jgi:curved DNA-binding protein